MARLSGQCLCKAVSVEATPDSEAVDACHCSMCRKWSGGPFIAMSCSENVEIEGGEAIGVYRSSTWAERVFCRNCGTVVAWRLQQDGGYHVSANLFAETAHYPLAMQVFIDEKPANYSFEQQTRTMTGAEVFAMFAPSQSG